MDEPKFICRRCTYPKLRGDFGSRGRERNKTCKTCCSEAVRKTYRKSVTYREAHKEGTVQIALCNHKRLFLYLLGHPCVDCGETDPLVLDFDHEKGTKESCVTSMVLYSWSRIQQEIDKCVVRCSYCHRKKTAKEENTIRYQLAQMLEAGVPIIATPARSNLTTPRKSKLGTTLECTGCHEEFPPTYKKLKRQQAGLPVYCSRRCSNQF